MPKGMLHHIELNVSNLAETRRFWDWFLNELGYELYQEWPKGVSWKLGEAYLVFVQTEDHFLNKKFHRKESGLNHLAFHVENRKAVDSWTLILKEKGYSILYEDRHPFAGGEEYYAVFFEDPNRIKVELVADE